jgi:hypothetical protein
MAEPTMPLWPATYILEVLFITKGNTCIAVVFWNCENRRKSYVDVSNKTYGIKPALFNNFKRIFEINPAGTNHPLPFLVQGGEFSYYSTPLLLFQICSIQIVIP